MADAANTPAPLSHAAKLFAFATIMAGTVMGLAGLDLVLPSVPFFPEIFGTTTAKTQMVLASFVAGTMFGLIAFGSFAARFGRRKLFLGSLLAYAATSFLAAYSPNIETLIGVRFLQGFAAAGSGVLAPGLIRHLFSELGAVRAISFMGSVEALVPGLAPLAGAALHSLYGWTASFLITAGLLAFICLIVFIRPSLLPSIGTKANMRPGSYKALLKNHTYLRYALGHAAVLGGLLVFVFSAPAVIIKTMGGGIEDFIYMQMVGVTCFILSANFSGNLVKRWGAETTIWLGSILSAIGSLILLAYSLYGNSDPATLKYLFWVLNIGLGIRGGTGFFMALKSAHDDDDRAAALILVAVMAIAAGMTAIVAPFLENGLIVVTSATCLIILPVVVLMALIKPFEDPEPEAS
jgi:DHA1 family bicyclomycin/chloramphenicol resistance-like MFS transporter